MKNEQINKLIVEALQKPKAKSCSCGCGTCSTNDAPILTESKVKNILSEGLQHHIDNKIPLHDTIYRYSSDKHLSLIKEAKKLYSRGIIDLAEGDKQLIETNLGEFGVFEGESVPLDLPMMNEEYYQVIANLGDKKAQENLDSFEEVQDFMNQMIKRNAISVDVTKLDGDKKQTIRYNWTGDKWEKEPKPVNEALKTGTYAGRKVIVHMDGDETDWEVEFENGKKVSYIDTMANLKFDDGTTYMDYLKEYSEYGGREVKLNKPKRGGSKAYYVYVKDPRSKKVKKVQFGSGGLRAKIKDKDARSAYAARHRCSKKKDRTTPGYWSCNLPRYAKALKLGNNINTFW